jgi:hypothetical protein
MPRAVAATEAGWREDAGALHVAGVLVLQRPAKTPRNIILRPPRQRARPLAAPAAGAARHARAPGRREAVAVRYPCEEGSQLQEARATPPRARSGFHGGVALAPLRVGSGRI